MAHGPARRPAAVLPLLALAVLAGCTAAGERTQAAGERAQTCVSWVGFDTPAEAVDDATVVVRTDRPAPVVRTVDLFGVDARVHAVTVAEVLKGHDIRVGDEVEVASTPVTCTGDEIYPEGDPLDATGPLIVLLHQDASNVWRTITPGQGVVPATVDGQVPGAWPSG
ncbi:MAG: hypothetical protein H5T83_04715 [Actinotalea sp.]|nr:hypothetical protein [Actinotalea sp.]